ncbi:hypothetical protein [Mucilaginibacter pedocola]|uniref:Uncharacterized protein n=1 Tax=Mucilaginibacter pedocola TaxID=1792845 RepID=A0A1S9PFP7_9SPHI|nr:hypothetical protein [Mucilaginibacter pedocola]OOQ59418.1 hypothetical protein BC343_04345 [Mucilaginibacter pedocola]
MLLSAEKQSSTAAEKSEEELIAQLITQQRFADAYLLLQKEAADSTVTQYNLSLCYYSAGKYREAILSLDKAQQLFPVNAGQTKPFADSFYTAMLAQQNQLDRHYQPISQKYINLMAPVVADAIIRLKTDCWLQMGHYNKVVELATPLAYKNYRNISEALAIAKQNLEKHEHRI